MFLVDDETGKITLHSGDTGSVTYEFEGITDESQTVVLWTMKNRSGVIVKEHLANISNGAVQIDFLNEDTDDLAAGNYTYDVRVVYKPIYDENDRLVDADYANGGYVFTPESPYYVEILSTVGHI